MKKFTPEEIKAKAKEVLESYKCNQSELISMLQEIQETYHYVPIDAINTFANGLNCPPQSIYGVTTFYSQFSLEPKGKYLVKICDGTACHIKNSAVVFDAIEKKLNLKNGKFTTEDGLFTLETVACLGACGIAPVMVINETVYPHVTPDSALSVVLTLVKREKEG